MPPAAARRSPPRAVTEHRFPGTDLAGDCPRSDYHPGMSVSESHPLPDAATRVGARSPLLTPRAVLVGIAAWSAIAGMQALAQYVDQGSRTGDIEFSFWHHLRFHLVMYSPWMLACPLLFGAVRRSRRPPTQVRVAAAWLAGCTLAFMPPFVAFTSVLNLLARGGTWAQVPAKIWHYPLAAVTYDYLFFVGTFAFVYSLAVFQRALEGERRRQRIEAENLALQLQVEEGRLASLRAQLEPHFLFNALNALSALVRGGEQLQALHAVQRLSELLRYAIAASGKEWTSLAEEVAFVEDYLALQRLRFGQRLDFVLDGGGGGWREVECPPLLLQPLVENALRHDLEAGSEASEIRMACTRAGDRVAIRISNPLRADAPANGGTGIGLSNVTGRLALVYGERASIHARREGDRFVVELDLPADVDAVPA
jgi:two-component system sensor histidine kinase AlgZ